MKLDRALGFIQVYLRPCAGSEAMDQTTTQTLARPLPEPVCFLLKSGAFLLACGAILYVALASDYPAVHDALHNVRHALAVVPCH
jgi:cobalt transporter subunit CbtB